MSRKSAPSSRGSRIRGSKSAMNDFSASHDRTLNPGAKRLEVGYLISKYPLTVYLFFEHFPVWLLALNVAWCNALIVCGHDSMSTLLLPFTRGEVDLLKVLLDPFLKQNKLSFHLGDQIDPGPNHLVLLSGSLVPYLVTHVDKCRTFRTLGVLDIHYVGRLRNGKPTSKDSVDAAQLSNLEATWQRLRHSTIGGASEFNALVVRANIAVPTIVSDLQRGIRHFFDAGTRPGPPPSELPPNRLGHYYQMDDRVVPGHYTLPVLCLSHFHHSGTGFRRLSLAELAGVHGFPRNLILPSLPEHVIEWPPCQSLAACLEPVWTSHHTPPADVNPRPMKRSRENENETWLPSLDRYLPHDWIDESLITATASKVDDAKSPCRLWDVRLDLLFPGCTPKLEALRRGVLLWIRRRLLREIRKYLRTTFSATWVSDLLFLRHLKLTSGSSRELEGGVDKNFGDFVAEDSQRNKNKTQVVTRSLVLEADKAVEALTKICLSTWWEWELGSSLFFWRWGEQQELATYGMVPFIKDELPRNTKKGRSLDKNEYKELITEKLATILKKGYIEEGHVTSLIDFFAVPKGNDIRLVYNGTSCGLNGSTWAPNFWLPFPRTAIRLLDYGYYSADVDLGEMFLNFPLHQSIQASSGIDLSPFQKELGLGDGNKKVWYRWTRNWMGARLSPYSSVQFCSLVEEFVGGNNVDPDNALRWDFIVLNLPGSQNYDPSKPRVYKWDATMGCISGDVVIFVDDVRASAKTVELTWKISRQVCSRCQYLGVQDATRKRKPPTRTPGAWAGSVFATTEDTVTRTVTIEKWEKAKNIIDTLNKKIADGGDLATLGYKEMEVSRFFLCHLSMTYEVIVPFLKGFHLCLSIHQDKRDDDGWKLTDKAWQAYLFDKNDLIGRNGFISSDTINQSDKLTGDRGTPENVKVTEQLRNDLEALTAFLKGDVPPVVNDRCENIQIVRYGFGDASGTGFGSTIQTKKGLKYRVGVWGSDDENESSNYKELENVVSTIEEEAASGNLKGSALFFFTDNSTVEAALYRGNTTSRRLFMLVVRFRTIQFEYGMQVNVSHVSGKRMIQQGTDGVSRGNMTEGVGAGMEMIQFIPLHLGALERHKGLFDWIKAWAGSNVEYLSPSEWFTRGHDHDGGFTDAAGFWRINTKPGTFLWAPPPAAAEAAVEQLRRALIKRQQSTHIFICPRLLTTEWFKQLNKAADLVISLPAGRDNNAWPADMFEPLTIAFIFPFFRHKPWKRRGTPKLFDVGRSVSRMWKEGDVDSRAFLRKLFKKQLQFNKLSECVLRKMLYFKE